MKDKQRKILVLCISVLIGIMCLAGALINRSVNHKIDRKEVAKKAYDETTAKKAALAGISINEEFLTINDYSRPGIELSQVNDIVIHYVANPGSTADDNRSYFEGLSETHDTYASSHYIIGLEGEIVQCIPLNEISYCSNDRNNDTISIEVCHPGEDGKFTDESYNALVKLCAWLCDAYELNSENLIRHYDVTGKICPKYFVDHPDAWKKFKNDVKKKM